MPVRTFIPSPSPFSRQPMRWASPPQPGGPGAGPGEATAQPTVGLLSGTFGVRGTGVVGTAFPNLTQVASINFAQAIVLLNLSMASSIVNASTTAVAVLAVHKVLGSVINVSSSDTILCEHVVEQGLSHSQRSGTSFSDNIAPTFGTNEPLALYAVMPAAGCAFTAIINVRYLTLN